MGLVLNSLGSGKHGTYDQCCEPHAWRNILLESRVLNYLSLNQRSNKIYEISFDMFVPLKIMNHPITMGIMSNSMTIILPFFPCVM